MTLQRMRTDFQPRCNTGPHSAFPMVLVHFFGRVGPDSYSFAGFACAEPGCTRHYNITQGYFDVVDNEIKGLAEQELCPRCGSPMYIESFQPAGPVIRAFRCPQFGCKGSRDIRAQRS